MEDIELEAKEHGFESKNEVGSDGLGGRAAAVYILVAATMTMMGLLIAVIYLLMQ